MPLQFAQELISTFSTSLGEVSLQPSTGGVFKVEIYYTLSSTTPADNVAVNTSGNTSNQEPTTGISSSQPGLQIQQKLLWDRKVDGGFPETKELKRRVRDVIEPGRNLGHVDRDHGKEKLQRDEASSKAANMPSSNATESTPQSQDQPPQQEPNSSFQPDPETTYLPSHIKFRPKPGGGMEGGFDARRVGGGIKPLAPPAPGADEVNAEIAEANRQRAAAEQRQSRDAQGEKEKQGGKEECEDCK